MRRRRRVHRGGESSAFLGEVPAAVAFFGKARAARGRGHGKPASGNRAVHARKIARFGARAAIAAVGEVDRPDERRSIETELLRLLKWEGHLRASLVQEEW